MTQPLLCNGDNNGNSGADHNEDGAGGSHNDNRNSVGVN